MTLWERAQVTEPWIFRHRLEVTAKIRRVEVDPQPRQVFAEGGKEEEGGDGGPARICGACEPEHGILQVWQCRRDPHDIIVRQVETTRTLTETRRLQRKVNQPTEYHNGGYESSVE